MPSYRAGSAFIAVTPSLRGFQEKLKAEMAKVRPVDVEVNPKVSEADKAKAQAVLDETARDRRAGISPEVDDAANAAAEEKLNRTARTRTARIKTEVDNLPRGLGLLGTAGVAFGPALIPMAAAATGLVAALSAPLAAAGGGGTLYALIAGKRVADTNKAIKALQQLRDKVEADKKAVAAAATSASRATAQKTLTADTKAYEKALKALDPEQKQFAKSLDTLRTRYERLSRHSHVLEPINGGLGLLATIMPRLEGPLSSVTDTLDALLSRAERGVKHGALDGLFEFIEKWNGPALTGLADTTWNIARGIGSMVNAAAPMGGKVLDNIESWSKGFAHIGQSKGFKSLLGYVRDEGPDVAHTLDDVAGATAHILKALAPIGHVSLHALDALAKGVEKIPTGVLTTAGGALAAILVSLKGIRAAKGAVSFLTGLKGIGRLGGGRLGGGLLGGIGKGVVPVYVTNWGGKPGVPGVPSERGGAGAGRKGVLGRARSALGKGAGIFASALGPIGLGIGVGSLANSLGLNPFKGETGQQDWSGRVKGIKAFEKAVNGAAHATHDQAQQQAALNNLLLSPALPHYGKTLRSLPKKVQTIIATPGAVKSGADVARLAKQYHLTPKQVRTVVNLLGAQGALGETIRLGRQYHLTPKQVRTIIAQAGMDHSQAEIRKLAHQYDITPKQVHTLIRATDRASGVIARVKAQLASIPRSVRTDYYVNTVNAGIKHQNFGYGTSAMGSTVPKDGGPYVDRYPYLLAPGEEVISNRRGQADRWRPVLKAINAGRLAGGGTAGDMLSSVSVSWADDFGLGRRPHGHSWLQGFGFSLLDLTHTVRGTKEALADQRKELDKDKQSLADLRSARDQLKSSIVQGFSQVDLAGGHQYTDRTYVTDLQVAEQQMFANRVHADMFKRDLTKLRKLGISDAAFTQISSEDAYNLADQLAQSGRAEVKHYSQLLAQQNASTAAVAAYAGRSVYGADIKALVADRAEDRRVIKELSAQLKHLQHVRKDIHDGAKSGVTEGMHDAAKGAQHRARNTPGGR